MSHLSRQLRVGFKPRQLPRPSPGSRHWTRGPAGEAKRWRSALFARGF